MQQPGQTSSSGSIHSDWTSVSISFKHELPLEIHASSSSPFAEEEDPSYFLRTHLLHGAAGIQGSFASCLSPLRLAICKIFMDLSIDIAVDIGSLWSGTCAFKLAFSRAYNAAEKHRGQLRCSLNRWYFRSPSILVPLGHASGSPDMDRPGRAIPPDRYD